MPPALFVDLLLNFRDSPATEGMVGGRARNVYRQFDLHHQLIYHIVHGLAEVVRFLSIQSPVEESTDVSTEQPDFDVIQFVDHGVLAMCELEMSHHRRGKNIP